MLYQDLEKNEPKKICKHLEEEPVFMAYEI